MEAISNRQNIVVQWVIFHFFDAPKWILKAWRNFLLFNLNYFSIKVLSKTLFSYWHKYRWAYPKGFSVGKYLETLFSNTLSRVIGAITRIFLIIIGILVEIFILAAGAVIFLGWLALPFVLIFGLKFGFGLLF